MFEFFCTTVFPVVKELIFVATILVVNKLIKQLYSSFNHVNFI